MHRPTKTGISPPSKVRSTIGVRQFVPLAKLHRKRQRTFHSIARPSTYRPCKNVSPEMDQETSPLLLLTWLPVALLREEEARVPRALEGRDPVLEDCRAEQDNIPWLEGNPIAKGWQAQLPSLKLSIRARVLPRNIPKASLAFELGLA
ncbi:hypothetical protein VC83_09564 [Pseudogymnoascus destructans]|uniref:Uncharacterized protein n=1 Tax=Pseudogymnoascus destructans TaxID=655981 RepID=A0A176ZW75_9PEZI|nr:uncharacterized protein VC83_09564 [Pseudogymnoascus destructans]OAF54215.2 hypothetical protein VC83_09564 [Pseudogymnoascus destructans]